MAQVGNTRDAEVNDTETAAIRLVEGGELHLRRRPGASWEVSFYDMIVNAGHRTERIGELFRGETFTSPDDAAAACRRLVVL